MEVKDLQIKHVLWIENFIYELKTFLISFIMALHTITSCMHEDVVIWSNLSGLASPAVTDVPWRFEQLINY